MTTHTRTRILDAAEALLSLRTWRNVAAGAAWAGLTPLLLMLLAIVLMLAAILAAVVERL